MQLHEQVCSFQKPVDSQSQADLSCSREKVSASCEMMFPVTLTLRIWFPQLSFTSNPLGLKPPAMLPVATETPSKKATKLDAAKILRLATPMHEA
jgi:hypothetical protein